MQQSKKGTKVVCLEDKPHSSREITAQLELGKIYTIERETGILFLEEMQELDELGGRIGWGHSRFRIATQEEIAFAEEEFF